MSFNGTEGGFIDLATGKVATKAYRDKYPGAVKARFLGKDKLLEVLNQEGCMGLRIYFALDTSSVLDVVVVGADSGENDMLNKILDMSVSCPSRCSTANALNS